MRRITLPRAINKCRPESIGAVACRLFIYHLSQGPVLEKMCENRKRFALHFSRMWPSSPMGPSWRVRRSGPTLRMSREGAARAPCTLHLEVPRVVRHAAEHSPKTSKRSNVVTCGAHAASGFTDAAKRICPGALCGRPGDRVCPH